RAHADPAASTVKTPTPLPAPSHAPREYVRYSVPSASALHNAISPRPTQSRSEIPLAAPYGSASARNAPSRLGLPNVPTGRAGKNGTSRSRSAHQRGNHGSACISAQNISGIAATISTSENAAPGAPP